MLNLILSLVFLLTSSQIALLRWMAGQSVAVQALYAADGTTLYEGEGRGVAQPHIAAIRGGLYVRNAMPNECPGPTNVEIWAASNWQADYVVVYRQWGKTYQARLEGVSLEPGDDAVLTKEYHKQYKWLSKRMSNRRDLWCRAWSLAIRNLAKRLGYRFSVQVVR